MIIQLLLSGLYNIFEFMTILIKIPSMPSDTYSSIGQVIQYIQSGVSILANYCNTSYLLTLFSIVIAVDVGVGIYHFVMWVIRKIPVVSIS